VHFSRWCSRARRLFRASFELSWPIITEVEEAEKNLFGRRSPAYESSRSVPLAPHSHPKNRVCCRVVPTRRLRICQRSLRSKSNPRAPAHPRLIFAQTRKPANMARQIGGEPCERPDQASPKKFPSASRQRAVGDPRKGAADKGTSPRQIASICIKNLWGFHQFQRGLLHKKIGRTREGGVVTRLSLVTTLLRSVQTRTTQAR
jgi:hypothetical protein